MKRIDLKIGFSCNNNCLFCVQGHKKIFGNRKTSELKDHISQSASEGYKAIVFTGGEPTIHADIIELVKYARKVGFTLIQIQSNGRRFAYMDFCKKIIEAGANQFAPSVHGPTPEIHDHLTHATGAFAQAILGIKNLKTLKQDVITNTVITKLNYRYLPDIAELLVYLRVDQFQLAFVHMLGNAEENLDSIVPKKSVVAPYIKKALDISKDTGTRAMTEAIPYCFMRGYERYVAEENIPDTKVFDLDNIVENFTESRKVQCKIKAEKCHECVYCQKCEGPWKEYPEHFGWEEFKPVRL
jgi:MoaA/NifB/PqqE/SkfB family radical SAM enzyme